MPSCQIASPQDTSSLHRGEELSLNLSISRYYCSDVGWLMLMMGKYNSTLINETLPDITNRSFGFKERVTASQFGIVKLFLECGSFRQAISCEGVQLLESGKWCEFACACKYTFSILITSTSNKICFWICKNDVHAKALPSMDIIVYRG